MPFNKQVIDIGVTGKTIYTLWRKQDADQWWSVTGSALENWQDGHYSNYHWDMSEIGTSGMYEVGAPTSLPSGGWDFFCRQKAGGSYALTDVPKGALGVAWDGTQFTSDVISVSDAAAAMSTAIANLLASIQAAGSNPAAGTLTAVRGDDWAIAITGLGNITGNTKLWFTLKFDPVVELDSASVVQIERTVGLEVIAGAAASGGQIAQGSIVVTDATAGNIVVHLSAAMSALLDPRFVLTYDVQVLNSGLVTRLRQGPFIISADVTRAVS